MPNQISTSHSLGILYGSFALFSSIMHNVFLIYHVETFVMIYKISKLSFWIGESIFLLWNSMNDPLFGWISDRSYLTKKCSVFEIVSMRLQKLSWNGPFLSLSFVLFWISWGYPTIQFVVCLCLYDGFLTIVDLHHSALLADIAISATVRTQLNKYCSFFSSLGSFSVFVSYMVWNREKMLSFQVFCFILSLFSFIGFILATHFLRKLMVKHFKSQGDFVPW